LIAAVAVGCYRDTAAADPGTGRGPRQVDTPSGRRQPPLGLPRDEAAGVSGAEFHGDLHVRRRRSHVQHAAQRIRRRGIGHDTPIRFVAQVNGASATADASQIRVSGKTLLSLVEAHSTGLKPGQLRIAFELTRIDSAWYVSNMDMNVRPAGRAAADATGRSDTC
jgi:hypothetical protein